MTELAMFAPSICRGETLFRSARSDEDGDYPANIAASGASNQTELRAERAIKQSCERSEQSNKCEQKDK